MQQTQHHETYEEEQAYEDDHQYPEEEMETVHVYWYPEKPKKPLSGNAKHTIIACVELALLVLCLAGICLLPNTSASPITTITVPAHFLPLQILKASVAIVPTGKQEYPATRATGTLTIYNGSVFTQQLPANFLFTTQSGLGVATDQAVLIPAADLPSLGIAAVSAHAVLPGSQGNIAPDAIQATYGSSIKIKNLAPFIGGQDAYTKQYVTSGDKTRALTAARHLLASKQPLGLLAKPCTEQASQQSLTLSLVWTCQYVTYQTPKGVQVLSVHISGDNVSLTVRMVARPVVTHGVK